VAHTLAVLTNKPEAPSRRLLEAFELPRRFVTSLAATPSGASRTRWALRAGCARSGPRRNPPRSSATQIDVETAAGPACRCVALYGFGQLRGELVDGTELTVNYAP
jgi:hypothetical protein